MGLILDASCACGFSAEGLRLGATHEEIARHDVEVAEIFRTACCTTLLSVQVLLGQPLPAPLCPGCGQAVTLAPESRYAIARLSGVRLEGHPCPRCGEPALSFREQRRFL
ncbi:MAG: hypothetical protein AB7N76_26820 [Planctomycetota bacterium]